MKWLLVVVAVLGLLARPARAHRLDEYLQATILSIGPGTVQGTVRLVPGVAVAPGVIAGIDSNHDGELSGDEERSYAGKVLSDLRLNEDGRALKLHLKAETFPSMEEMKLGTGEIQLAFSADVASTGGQHELTFENHHRSDISVYLVNSLEPQDKALQLEGQTRNQNQSSYEVTIAEAGVASPRELTLSGLGAAFRLGVRHIAEGTDHLLFLLTLLLPAPLVVSGGRWSGRATVRRSMMQILGIVSAFTVGHSLTLALSGLGLVRIPSRPVEVLIAVSILVSAMHAIRPIFPGREALIAAAFGLVHGLAFASALNGIGVNGWYRLVSLLGFNLGIEAMQLAVVAVSLPALILLSRTAAYPVFRRAGALLAIAASSAWLVERVFDRPTILGEGIERIARHGELLAALLWGVSLLASAVQQGGAVFRGRQIAPWTAADR